MSLGVVLTAPAYCSKARLEWLQRAGYHMVTKRPDRDTDWFISCNKLPLQWWISEFQLYRVTMLQDFRTCDNRSTLLEERRSWPWSYSGTWQKPAIIPKCLRGCNVSHWAVHSAASTHKSLKASETDHCSVANDCNDCILGDLLQPQSSWKRAWHVSWVALAIGGKKGPG